MNAKQKKSIDDLKAKMEAFQSKQSAQEGFGASEGSGAEVLEVIKAFQSTMSDLKGLPFSTIAQILLMFIQMFVKDPTLQETLRKLLDLVGQLAS